MTTSAPNLVPNIDRPYDRGGPFTRIHRGKPSGDVEIDRAPRVTMRGRVRTATSVEWLQKGRGLFAYGSRAPGGDWTLSLYPYVAWVDTTGKSGRMELEQWRALRLAP